MDNICLNCENLFNISMMSLKMIHLFNKNNHFTYKNNNKNNNKNIIRKRIKKTKFNKTLSITKMKPN